MDRLRLIAQREHLLSIDERLRPALEKSPGEMTYSHPLALDESIFDIDRTTDPITKVIDQFASSQQMPVFWTRPDSRSIFVTINVEPSTSITLKIDANQPNSQYGVLKLDYKGWVNIPKDKEDLFKSALERILNSIKFEDENITGLVVEYKSKDAPSIFYTIGEAYEIQ